MKMGTEPLALVFRLHSLAALGRSSEAIAAYSAVNDNAPPPIISLREALAARYGFKQSKAVIDERSIFDQEAEVLLQAA